MNGKTLLQHRQKHKHFSSSKIDTICNCDLQQLLYWYDDSTLDYQNKQFVLSADGEVIIYPNIGYNFYTGKAYTPLQVLTDELHISYADALYLLNYFYYKVKKAPLNAALTGWTALSYSGRCATGKNDSLDLDYIIEEDLFNSTDTETKAYAYKRAIAYLCDRRHIDKDIVLNLIKQGFLKMDKQHNLCFVGYADPFQKVEVISITKKGTTDKRFCPNYIKEHHTGFFYAKKDYLEAQQYKELYIFESPVDLLSFLTLVQAGQIDLASHTPNACFISLNGVGNRQFLDKLLERYPTLERVNLCLDNDTKGIEGAAAITTQIGDRCTVEDLRCPILKEHSGKDDGNGGFTFYKDYNDLLTKQADIRVEL